MSSPLDRIEARAKQVIDRADNEPGWTPAGHFSAPAVLALVNVAKAAERLHWCQGSPHEVEAWNSLGEALAALHKDPSL